MEFREEYAWPLTRPTSVYTGARRRLSSVRQGQQQGDGRKQRTGSGDGQQHDPPDASTTNSIFRLATEYNTLQLSIEDEDESNTCTEESAVVYRDKAYYTVGYDALGDWEVLVLLQRPSSSSKSGEPHTKTTSTGNDETKAKTATGTADAGGSTPLEAPKGATASSASQSIAPSTTDQAVAAAAAADDDPSRLTAIEHRRNLSLSSTSNAAAMTGLGDVFTSLNHYGGASLQQSLSSGCMEEEHSTMPNDSANSLPVVASNVTTSAAAAPLTDRIASSSSSSSASPKSPPATRDKPCQSIVLLRNRVTGHEYRRVFSTRPLSPTLAVLPVKGATIETATLVVLWLGDADTNKLQLCHPSPDDNDNNDNGDDAPTLVCHDVLSSSLFESGSSETFAMGSPVMGIDCIVLTTGSNGSDQDSSMIKSTCCLAMAGQDGTIRIITFDYLPSTPSDTTTGDGGGKLQLPFAFDNIHSHTVTVDGPIVCLHLYQHANGRSVQLVLGSLCGYVCEMFMNRTVASNDDVDADDVHKDEQSSDGNNFTWTDPKMVADDFYSSRLQAEDSVLTVHAHKNFVLIGTFTGRCCAYEKVDGMYELVWQCQLPYSVHQVVMLDARRFLVTTRRSVHLFSGRRIQYDPDLALQRLRKLLKERGILFPPLLEVTVVPEGIKEAPEADSDMETAVELDAPGAKSSNKNDLHV